MEQSEPTRAHTKTYTRKHILTHTHTYTHMQVLLLNTFVLSDLVSSLPIRSTRSPLIIR